MMLRALDHDLNVVFNTKGWRDKDLISVDINFKTLTAMWHEVRYKKHELEMMLKFSPEDQAVFQKFNDTAEAMFRKYYKTKIYPTRSREWDQYPSHHIVAINRYARHLGLPLVVDDERPEHSFHEVMIRSDQMGRDPMEGMDGEGSGDWSSDRDDWICIKLGHLKKGEKL
jgi:hypothetical protein